MWSPLTYLATQRDKEREMFLSALREVLSTVDRQTELVLEQTKTLRHLTDHFFAVHGEPIRRVMDDETEFELELTRSQADPLKVYGES